MASASQIPRIGIGVFIVDPATKRFILGQRKGSHGAGTWALPGGHLELYEDFQTCAAREVLEETGLQLTDIQYLTVTNSPRIDGNKHYVTVFMVAKRIHDSQEPELLEPNKCEGWRWVDWDEFLTWYEVGKRGASTDSSTLFQPMIDFIEQHPGLRPVLK